jgi:hypothetical protein
VGMLDIVHALRWVRENIEQFGGRCLRCLPRRDYSIAP